MTPLKQAQSSQLEDKQFAMGTTVPRFARSLFPSRRGGKSAGRSMRPRAERHGCESFVLNHRRKVAVPILGRSRVWPVSPPISRVECNHN